MAACLAAFLNQGTWMDVVGRDTISVGSTILEKDGAPQWGSTVP